MRYPDQYEIQEYVKDLKIKHGMETNAACDAVARGFGFKDWANMKEVYALARVYLRTPKAEK